MGLGRNVWLVSRPAMHIDSVTGQPQKRTNALNSPRVGSFATMLHCGIW